MSDILYKICAAKRQLVEQSKKIKSISDFDAEIRVHDQPPRGFAKALRTKIKSDGIAFIAEIKKASPSAGVIRPDFSPQELAQDYTDGGAACLSVLTDTPYFQGHNEDILKARLSCILPILRKDFMVDPWQVAEARAIGADCILLIMAALDDAAALELHAAAVEYGMDVLIETHNEAELERALALPSGLIGINNRDLKTLHVDLGTTVKLASLVPEDRLLVSESGITSPADIALMKASGAYCFLVGESLLRQKDVGTALKKLYS